MEKLSPLEEFMQSLQEQDKFTTDSYLTEAQGIATQAELEKQKNHIDILTNPRYYDPKFVPKDVTTSQELQAYHKKLAAVLDDQSNVDVGQRAYYDHISLFNQTQETLAESKREQNRVRHISDQGMLSYLRDLPDTGREVSYRVQDPTGTPESQVQIKQRDLTDEEYTDERHKQLTAALGLPREVVEQQLLHETGLKAAADKAEALRQVKELRAEQGANRAAAGATIGRMKDLIANPDLALSRDASGQPLYSLAEARVAQQALKTKTNMSNLKEAVANSDKLQSQWLASPEFKSWKEEAGPEESGFSQALGGTLSVQDEAANQAKEKQAFESFYQRMKRTGKLVAGEDYEANPTAQSLLLQAMKKYTSGH